MRHWQWSEGSEPAVCDGPATICVDSLTSPLKTEADPASETVWFVTCDGDQYDHVSPPRPYAFLRLLHVRVTSVVFIRLTCFVASDSLYIDR